MIKYAAIVLLVIFGQAHGFTLLSQNLGSAQVRWDFQPVCPSFKLCSPEVIEQAKKLLSKYRPEIIALQELASSEQMNLILPDGYDSFCSMGDRGVFEICTAWNKRTITKVGECRAFSSKNGGAHSCLLLVDGKEIQVGNVHPSAWDIGDRKLVIQKFWETLVDSTRLSVVAGDFNTEFFTYHEKTVAPVPRGYRTLFGRYQRTLEAQPSESFFGYYRNQFAVHSFSTIFFERIDHIFSNIPAHDTAHTEDSLMPCGHKVCLGNRDGFHWGPAHWEFGVRNGPQSDHLPIMVKIDL